MLSYGRIHPELESLKSARLGSNVTANLRDLVEYGPAYLDRSELNRQIRSLLAYYYGFLAVNAFRKRGSDFWEYHKRSLDELGYPLRKSRLVRAGARKVLRQIANPQQMIQKCWQAVIRRPGAESRA